MLQSVNESLGDRDVFWLKLFMRNCCDWIDNAVVVLHAASMCMYDSKVTLILGICRLYSFRSPNFATFGKMFMKYSNKVIKKERQFRGKSPLPEYDRNKRIPTAILLYTYFIT